MLGKVSEVLVFGLQESQKVLGKLEHVSRDSDEDQVVSGRDAMYATRVGQVAGTLLYMAPEQALGQIDKLNAQTDIYALGAITVEFLVSQPPFVGSSPIDTLEQVRSRAASDIEKHADITGGKKQSLRDCGKSSPLSSARRTFGGV